MSSNRSPSTGTSVPLTVSAPFAASPPALDFIPPEKEKLLFNAFFDASMPSVEIARELDVSVSALAQWGKQPHIRERLIEIAEFGRMRTHMLASDLGCRAVHTLDSVSRFHQGDLDDPRQTGAIARRRDVSRKSATDTIRIGDKDIRALYGLEHPEDDDSEPTPSKRSSRPRAITVTVPPEHEHLFKLLLRPNKDIEHILNNVGRAAGSVASASEAADTTNRPPTTSTPQAAQPDAPLSEISNLKSEIPEPAPA